MNTARSNATNASSRIHPIGVLFPYMAAAAVAALAAACSIAPTPPLKTSQLPETRLRTVAFAELPGWNDDALIAAWPAFIAQCPTLLAQVAGTPIWRDACTAALLSTPDNDAAARAFFDSYRDGSIGTVEFRSFWKARLGDRKELVDQWLDSSGGLPEAGIHAFRQNFHSL